MALMRQGRQRALRSPSTAPSAKADVSSGPNGSPSSSPGYSFSQRLLFNYASNDESGAYTCTNYYSNYAYFQQPFVREALHVPDYVQAWDFCIDNDDFNYTDQYNTIDNMDHDMTDVFQGLINHPYVSTTLGEPFRMLIYNGDSDIVCSFLEAEFFIDNLATNMSASVTVPRQEWLYSVPGSSPVGGPGAAAGFRKSYGFAPNVQLDLLTVKGSGHFVPLDRSGPALQMLYNFLSKSGNYNTTLKYNLARQPLKPQYQPNPPSAQPDQPPVTTTTTTTTTTATPTTTTTAVNDTTNAPAGSGSAVGMGIVWTLALALLAALICS